MKIKRFKLLRGGKDGILIEAKEYLKSGRYAIVDDVQRTRKLEIPKELIDEISKLKYYFLNITGHWIHPYTKFYDAEAFKLFEVEDVQPTQSQLILKDLWSKTSIIYASADEKGFTIGGRIDMIENKPIVINCPAITADDDIGFYNECIDLIDLIVVKIIDYFKIQAIPMEAGKANLPIEETEGKTITEITDLVVAKFEEKGAIILVDANTQQDSLPEITDKSEAVLHTGTGSIDGKNIEQVEDEDKKSESEKKTEPFGKPASEKEFNADLSKDTPQAKQGEKDDHGDLGHLEHTENVEGVPADSQSQDEEW